MERKKCLTCKKEKPLTDFSPKASGKFGVQQSCKKCRTTKGRIDRNGSDFYRKEAHPVIDGKKKCGKCLQVKDVKDYVTRPNGIAGGYYRICRDCMNDKSKNWQSNNPDKKKLSGRKTNLKRNFNLTIEDYDRILMDQAGGCAICGATRGASHRVSLYVDHNHKTGEIRGLLCGSCNSALGFLKDNPDLVKNAATYMMGM